MQPGTTSQVLVDATARLRGAFVSRVDEVTLKEAVCAFVDVARAAEWTVERMIIEIKRIAGVENGPPVRRDPFDRAKAQQQLDRAITWCVQHYYQA